MSRRVYILSWLGRVARWVLGGLFIYAGSRKLLDIPAFSEVVSDYGLVPEFLLEPFSAALPALEVIAGLGLIANRGWALRIISALLAGFILVLTYGLWLGLDVDCGCFAPGDPEADSASGIITAVYRDLAMMAAVAFLYYERFQILKNDPDKPENLPSAAKQISRND